LLLKTPAKKVNVTMEAKTMATIMGGASQCIVCARKHSGMIQARNGWKKVTLRTLKRRSMERGANHESRRAGEEAASILR